MHVIAKSALRVFWRNHPPAEHPLIEWYNVMRRARFTDLNDLHAVFPWADYVPPFVVFDIGGNKYRLITEIFFGRQKLFIRDVLTHAEYDRGSWRVRK
ncbi:MAG: type II toxin-antitoxin system HigB family toxin [Gammaproteobacteria bacterium]